MVRKTLCLYNSFCERRYKTDEEVYQTICPMIFRI